MEIFSSIFWNLRIFYSGIFAARLVINYNIRKHISCIMTVHWSALDWGLFRKYRIFEMCYLAQLCYALITLSPVCGACKQYWYSPRCCFLSHNPYLYTMSNKLWVYMWIYVKQKRRRRPMTCMKPNVVDIVTDLPSVTKLWLTRNNVACVLHQLRWCIRKNKPKEVFPRNVCLVFCKILYFVKISFRLNYARQLSTFISICIILSLVTK